MADAIAQFLGTENFALAWGKVAANQGCAGVDGETVAQFDHALAPRLGVLRRQVAQGTYRPLPLRQIFIPKRQGGWRELRVPTVRDRIVQQALLNVLHPVFEPQFEGCSYAYRPGRSHKMAVERIAAHQRRDYKGHLWSAEYDDIHTEMVQYQRQGDEAFKLATAQAIVGGKLANSRQLLLRLNRKRQMTEVATAIAALADMLESGTQAASLNSLRGYEGAAAAIYFRALGALIVNPAFTFTERNRRPPKDPVNSLLSFGYMLLFNNVLSLLLAEGLNPYLGNLHGSEKKQTFLAFDLVEEFRSPVVDSLVLKLINRRIFLPTDFTWPNAEGGIYLNETPRRLFIQKVETRLGETVSHPDVQTPVSYRRAMQLQVKRYKRSLLEGVPYQPFLRAT